MTEVQSELSWWNNQPVLAVKVANNIANREQAYKVAQAMIGQLEASDYKQVVVILDLTALGQSPSAAVLLGGNFPKTDKIEHLIMINASWFVRLATMPMLELRNKLHFVSTPKEAQDKANELLLKLRR